MIEKISLEEMTRKVNRHADICKGINELYQQKNFAYGDAFAKSLAAYGPEALNMILDHKMGRLKAITDNPALVGDEAYTDTVRDIANYCIIALGEMTPAPVSPTIPGDVKFGDLPEEQTAPAEDDDHYNKDDLEGELEEYSKAELVQVANEIGVKTPKKTTKAEVVELLMKEDIQKVTRAVDKLFSEDGE